MALRGCSFQRGLLRVLAMILSWVPLAGGFLRLGQHYRCFHVSTRLLSVREPVGEAPATNKSPLSPPKTISPSSIADFKTCPQLYRFRYIDKVPEPPKEALVRGSMIHEALERLYELPPSHRTKDRLHNLFRAVWKRQKAQYEEALFPTEDMQREFGLEGLRLLDNYFRLENPQLNEPKMREFRMRLELDDDGPVVTGVVDRVDEEEDGELTIVDYKTGKAPDFKYKPETNQRIMHDKFFQLKVYGLMLQQHLQRLPTKLRLLYFTGSQGPQDLVLTPKEGDFEWAEQELRSVWSQILEAVEHDRFPTKVGKLCDWCSCKSICPAWSKDSWATAGGGVHLPLKDTAPAAEGGGGGMGGGPEAESAAGLER